MLYVLQAENRSTKLFSFLMGGIKRQTQEMGGEYILEDDPLALGSEIAPEKSEHKANYAKFALIQALTRTADEGDLIIYLDSDVYARPWGLQSLVYQIMISPKSIFLTTYVSKVATPIIGIKVTKATKAVIGTMNIEVLQEYRKTAYGEALTSDEEIWHNAMDYNHMGIMELLSFLPARKFGAILQEEMYGNKIPHIQADKNSCLVHFMGTSKELAIDYLKQNDGVKV